jgi:hypothetical protein
MLSALDSLLSAGARAGTVRPDITAADMFAALTGIALASGKPDRREQAERLLDLTLDGLSAGRRQGLPPAGCG